MGSLPDAIKQLREESKYIHILSRAHKTLDESGLFKEKKISKVSRISFVFSSMVSTKNA